MLNPQPLSFTFEEAAPSPFSFEATVRSHGWAALRPFAWQEPELSRTYCLPNGQVVDMRLQAGQNSPASMVQVKVEASSPLVEAEQAEIRRAVRRMLRLDEDLTEFYQMAAQFNTWPLRLQTGGGRLLRCPSLFEDIIYTLCTTNISWSGTIRMVDRLTAKLGRAFPGQPEQLAFPTAAAIAAAGPEFLKQEVGLGYRSSYIWELASAVAEGRLELNSFEDPALPTPELHQALLQIKGIGPYAAATILMILGRYEHLAIDTEMKAFVSKKYFAGQPVTDAQIRGIYAPWGRWQYLAYWFDAVP